MSEAARPLGKVPIAWRCPRCNGATRIKNSRPVQDAVRRRRLCRQCGHRFSTWETTLRPATMKAMHDMISRLKTIIADFEARPDDDD